MSEIVNKVELETKESDAKKIKAKINKFTIYNIGNTNSNVYKRKM
jgi:hypothetical protein